MDVTRSEAPLILLADDDVRSGRLLVRLLEDDGFDVELATDGALAIARLARQPTPDILITDLRMPHVDGIAITRFARSLRPALPVFMLTGYPEIVARLEQGFDPRIVVHTKPVDYTALSGQLRACAQMRPSQPPPKSVVGVHTH